MTKKIKCALCELSRKHGYCLTHLCKNFEVTKG